ncbi:TRAP transporter substrate-binding protein [Fodinicurvata sediminis]|uniref:TRAP transporter substrate-binding protein n=1 Tax=Fodinicurvata sediminis TaxID=1121832 RepID=UPI00040BB95E|nr:TRAP transporter substrate-binding protein [Fodinicurvata sediminis]
MSIRNIFAAAVIGAVVVPAGSSAQDSELTWDMANEYGASTLMGQADQKFGEFLSEESENRIEVVNQYGGALGIKSNDMLSSVGTGAIPLGNFPIQSAAGTNPLFLVSNLPFLVSDPDEAFALQDVMRPYLEDIFLQHGAKLLYLSNWPSVGIWANDPINGLADLEGEKIRTNDVMATEFFKKAGAHPLQIPWTDVIPQLQAGAISMVHTSSAGGISVSMWEHLSAYTDIGMMMSANAAIINLSTYEKLDAEEKTALDTAAQRTEKWVREKFKSDIKEHEITMQDNGMEILTVDDISSEAMAEYSSLSEELINEWLEDTGENGQKLLDEYLEETGKSL